MYNFNAGYGRALIDAVHSAVPTFGRIFVVLDPDDTDEENVQKMREVFGTDPKGQVRVFSVNADDGSTPLEQAYNAMEDNNNDVIVMDGNSTHLLSGMVTVAKNRCHFVGLDYLMGIHRAYGQSTKVQLGVTTSASDIGAFLNTGVRNSFRGIKFISNNTVAESLYTFIDGGEYTYMEDCEVYKSTDLDVTGSAEMVCNADSPRYVNCTFGSLADARSGAIIRATVLMTAGLAGSGKVARDVEFLQCNFWIQCTNTANRFVYGANATDVERIAVFTKCRFVCNGASSAVPAQNVAFGASLTVGSVLLEDCVAVNAGTAMSTTTGVFVQGAVPTAGTSGIAVQAS